MSDYLGLEGKRALVTGGTKGVGEAVVVALREAGATVLTTARSQPRNPGPIDHFVTADVSSVEGCSAVAAAVQHRLGGLDILVPCGSRLFSARGWLRGARRQGMAACP
jgi:NAD(P)-dependent dehydrogenase (short-subunit alcohol dehydrogenase family)